MEIDRLFWVVLVGLACVLAAIVLLLRSGRAVPGSGVGGGAHHVERRHAARPRRG